MQAFRVPFTALALSLTVGWGADNAASLTVASAAHPATSQMVVREAMKYLHYRYSFTGDTPKTGFSCIGFVSYVFRSVGVDMPDNLLDAKALYPVVPESDLLPGDIVFFQNTWGKGLSHVAIYIGNGMIIHAENPNRGVNTSTLRYDPKDGTYWQQHYLVAERPLGTPAVRPDPPPADRAHVVVVVPSLNFRAAHSLTGVVITVLTQGTVTSVLGRWHDWLNVSLANGTPGWVVKAGVRPATTGGNRPNRPGPDGGSRYGVVAYVNIHSGPSLTDPVISHTTPGMKVTLLTEENGFSKIQTPSRVTGWVESRFVERPTSRTKGPSKGHEGGTGAKTGGQGRKRSYPTGSLNTTAHLRTGPSLYARIIEWVPAGTRVTILGRVPLWDHVRVSAKLSGYVYSEFVSNV